VIDAQTNALGLLGTSAVFGLVVAAMVVSIGNISGAHMNPSVTLGLWLDSRIKGKDVPVYLASQLLGATLASFMVLHSIGQQSYLGATLPRNGDASSAFLVEAILTFLLVYVVLSTNYDNAHTSFSALAIGSTVAFGSLLGGKISGASMNPARSLGPALVSGNFSFHWIYWIAPTLGSVIAVAAYWLSRMERSIKDRSWFHLRPNKC